MITAAQIRAARALLGLGQVELAELAELGINTVKRLELSEEITGSARTLWKIQTALESAGVEFIPADDTKGPGVRLKHRTTKMGGRRLARPVKTSKVAEPKAASGNYETNPIIAMQHPIHWMET